MKVFAHLREVSGEESLFAGYIREVLGAQCSSIGMDFWCGSNLTELRMVPGNYPDAVIGTSDTAFGLFGQYPDALKILWLSRPHPEQVRTLLAKEVKRLKGMGLSEFVPKSYPLPHVLERDIQVMRKADVFLCSNGALLQSLSRFAPRALRRAVYFPWYSRDIPRWLIEIWGRLVDRPFVPLSRRANMVYAYEADFIRNRQVTQAHIIEEVQKCLGDNHRVSYFRKTGTLNITGVLAYLNVAKLHCSIPVYDPLDLMSTFALCLGVPILIGPGSGMYEAVKFSHSFPLPSLEEGDIKRVVSRLAAYFRYKGMQRAFSGDLFRAIQCWPSTESVALNLFHIIQEKMACRKTVQHQPPKSA